MKAEKTYLFPSLFTQLGKNRSATSRYSLPFAPRREHCMGDHSDDVTTRTQCSTRHDSHDPLGPTPVDKLPLSSSQCFPDRYSINGENVTR